MSTDDTMTSAERDVLLERAYQRQKWGDEHDDNHTDGALAEAAAYVACNSDIPRPEEADDEDAGWMVRLKARHVNDRRRQIVIAAALLIAEIERLDRRNA